jgi:hypothetical protein
MPVPQFPDYKDFGPLFDLQLQLVVLALKCGITHTASLMFGAAGSDYVNSDVSPGGLACHSTSHWGKHPDPEIARRDYIAYRHFYLGKLASLINQLAAIQLGSGKSLLDTTIIVAGTEFGESDHHVRNPQPLLLAGGGGIRMGQELNLPNRTSNDVYHTVLEALDIKVPNVGSAWLSSKPISKLLGG